MSGSAAAASWGSSSRQSELKAMVARVATGDETALAALYDETSSLLYSLALRITSNAEDAEEVAHDVYCRAWRKASNYDESRGSVMSWLVLMTRSVAIDLVRSRQRHTTVSVEVLLDVASSDDDSPEEQARIHETTAGIRQALACLSVEQRQAVELAFFGGLTHAELAEHLKVPLGTVKTRVRSGLIQLRRLLEELEE